MNLRRAFRAGAASPLVICALAIFVLPATARAGTPSSNPAVSELQVATTSLPVASQGVPDGNQMQATGGLAPYKWRKSGTYPKGLRLTATGLLSGSVSSRVTSGTYSIAVAVSDSASSMDTASATLSLVVIGTPGAPTSAKALGLNHALLVSWQAPVSDGGSPITGYVVRLSGAEGCTTTGLSCLVTDSRIVLDPTSPFERKTR